MYGKGLFINEVMRQREEDEEEEEEEEKEVDDHSIQLQLLSKTREVWLYITQGMQGVVLGTDCKKPPEIDTWLQSPSFRTLRFGINV